MNHFLATGFRQLVNEQFDVFLDDAFASLGPTLNISYAFAKMGIAVFALMHFAGPDRSNVLKALKWFPLLFILLNYATFTRAIFDFYSSLGESFIGTQSNWDEIELKILRAQVKAGIDTDLGWNLLNLKGDGLQTMVLAALSSSIVSVAHSISTIFFISVKALSIMYLFVLIIFGPLNIGLSFIPALSGMWKAWLQKFMNICLWVPMLYVVDAFMLKIVGSLVDELLASGAFDVGTILSAGLLMLMTCFFYAKAPTLSNFVVQGLNTSGSGLAKSSKHYGKKAVNAAMDAKSGGATKGIRTLTQ